MKTRNQLLLFAAAGVMFFASCKKDDPSPLSAEDAKLAFTSIEGDYNDLQLTMDDEVGLAVQGAFDNYSLPFEGVMKSPARLQSIQKDFMRTIKPTLAKGDSQIDPFVDFDFPSYTGTWTYNLGSWNHISTPVDKVVLVIPYGEGGTATLTYSDYQTKTIGEITYVSHLEAELKISTQATPVISWVYTASRGLTSISLKFVFNFGGYTQTESMSMAQTIGESSYKMTASVLFEVKKDGDVIYSTSANSVASEDMNGYSVSVDAKVRVMNIVIKWNIDFDNNTIKTDPNNYIKISVWKTNGAKVADIEFVMVGQEYQLYFVFTDGTTAPVSDFLDNLGYEIENFTWDIQYLGMNS